MANILIWQRFCWKNATNPGNEKPWGASRGDHARSIRTGGIYIVFRFRRGDKSQLGLVIKWRRSQLRSSERDGLWRSWSLGPLYIRTHQRLDQPR